MIRLLFILIVAGLVALSAVWLADHDGTLTLAIDGYEARTRVTVAAGLLIPLLAVLYVLIRLVLRGPAKLSAFFAARRARNAYHELSKGLIAAAAEDAHEAEHAAHHVQKLLGVQALVLLLNAEAAKLSGDEARQSAAYRAMLDISETEFLGLRGLFGLAMRRGDKDEALSLAIRAHALKPKAAVAVETLFDLRVARGEREQARALLDAALRAKILSPESANRRAASIAVDRELSATAPAEFQEMVP